MAESILRALLSYAQEHELPYRLVLSHFLVERFITRLGTSIDARSKLIIGGVAMLTMHCSAPPRPIGAMKFYLRDADDLSVVGLFGEVCTTDLDDGVFFDPASLTVARSPSSSGAERTRVRLDAEIGGIRLPVFADLAPRAFEQDETVDLNYPVMLSASMCKRPLCVSAGRAMADLFAVLSNEWMLDDRMYRYFDLLCLTRGAKVVKSQLAAMLRLVRDSTAIGEQGGTPIALTPGFAREAKRARSWQEFLDLNCLAVPSKQLQEARRSTRLSPNDVLGPRAGSLADISFVDLVAELRAYYVSCLQGTA